MLRYVILRYVKLSYIHNIPIKLSLFLCWSQWIIAIIIGCLASESFFVLFPVACSFPLTIATMISEVVAALYFIKEAGGIISVIGQTSTDCIM